MPTYSYEYGNSPFNIQLFIQSYTFNDGDNNVKSEQILIDPETYTGSSPTTIITGCGRQNDTIDITGYLTFSAYQTLQSDLRSNSSNTLKINTETYTVIIQKLNFQRKLEDTSGKCWFSASFLVV